MSSRKITLFYAVLIAVASLAVGMVLASRLDLAPRSDAQSMAVPSAEQRAARRPGRCHDVPEHRQGGVALRRQHPDAGRSSKAQNMSEFFGGDDMFDRFFGHPQAARAAARASRSSSRPAPGSSSARTA